MIQVEATRLDADTGDKAMWAYFYRNEEAKHPGVGEAWSTQTGNGCKEE